MSTLKKKAQVIMLPTNDDTNIFLKIDKLEHNFIRPLYGIRTLGWKYQHLYIVCDDEIKEGDWYASWETIDGIEKNHIIQQGNSKDPLDWYNGALNYKKVIATTDINLLITVNVQDDNNALTYSTDKPLPQPSQGFINKFIEQYNNNNIISDVMVEYDEFICENGHTMSYQTTCVYPHCNKYNHPVLKTDKNNEITISSVKNSWDRNEVISIIDLFSERFVANTNTAYKKHDITEWLKNNLK